MIVTEGSAISADTSGILSGELLNVNAVESVELVGESADGRLISILSAAVRPDAIGDGDNLNITTGHLILRDGAQAIVVTFERGNAGNLTVRAESVELSGVKANGQFASGLFASAERGSSGNGGNLTIAAQQLTIRDGAQVAAATFSGGNAGNLTVRASTVELVGEQLPRQNNIYKPSGLKASADIGSSGTGGNLTIETDRLRIRDGAEVQVSTLGAGRAGSLTIRAAESVELVGRTLDGQFASAIRAVSELEGVATNVSGDGGDVSIATNNAIVRDGADIRVSATGTGRAGNLNINASSLLLDDRAALRAETNAVDRGNIVLQSQDVILRRESNIITTNAKNTASGGNIRINTNNLVALENSDITANAQQSFGGRVTISAQGIFGTQFRDALTPASDITASSDLGAEFSGIVEINTPDVDPSRGLITLSTDTVDVGKLVAQRCLIDRTGNEFAIAGRGGLPPNPSDAFGESRILEDLGNEHRDRASPTSNYSQPTDKIVEARGWKIDSAGEVALTASYEVPSASIKCL